ncbi:PadR family transcriptional regulator [Piscirickettsia litoralis]|uniref:PadR family transcriptional regulator n=1 Tax=Piscirickettsia litoralis TaxID=1891921 RepID=A0ABX3A2B3_9GAMM|nr:PadR family transcriptional regulator [Piscirickettsia litoralis]ODN41768.1 hypothetical protein BGC07_00700 [Piscirickettsia litoralis]
MKKVNHSQFAILGHLLSQGPMSGYDIRKLAEESTGHFWQESMGHLYPTLNKMLGEGLISELEKDQACGGRERRCYQITEKGLQRFEAWLEEPVVQAPFRHVLLLKLYFGRYAKQNSLINHLKTDQNNMKEKIEFLKNVKQQVETKWQGDAEADYWLITLDYGLSMLEARLAWCERSLIRLEKKSKGN